MKNWTMLVCVALALCFAVGVTYAQEKGKKMEGTRISGKVESVDADAKTLSVTVKKEAGDEKVDLVINDDTKVFAGREAKTLADVKVGANVMVVYKKTDAGNTALVVRVMTGEEGGKGKGKGKGGG